MMAAVEEPSWSCGLFAAVIGQPHVACCVPLPTWGFERPCGISAAVVGHLHVA